MFSLIYLFFGVSIASTINIIHYNLYCFLREGAFSYRFHWVFVAVGRYPLVYKLTLLTLGLQSSNMLSRFFFPKKQEDRIIEEVSRYYAYYLRKNPIVETRQFYAEINSEKYEMLHAKQMVVVLRNPAKKWTKYVKFGGSYNPAGRAQNMWEINAISFNGIWDQSDEGPNSSKEKNPIKEYLENVIKVVVEKYSQPFPWGQRDFKLPLHDKIAMGIARSLWF